MLQNIIKYYEKVTDLALKNIVQEKSFQFKSKLNNRNLLIQSEDHLIQIYKKAGGGVLSKEAKNHIDTYKKDMSEMYKLAIKDYNSVLTSLKATNDIDKKQKILNKLADRGITGFKSKSGALWNLETYTNMYFTHLNNEMVRLGVLDSMEGDMLQISSHSTKCELCKPWEGKIMKKSELENARSQGLFHPRCRHIVLE